MRETKTRRPSFKTWWRDAIRSRLRSVRPETSLKTQEVKKWKMTMV